MSIPMLSLEYNSTRDKLHYPEYGRFIQKLVIHCKNIEDKEERQAVAELIIDMMQQMNPPVKNINEYKNRLWRHFFRMADFDIDVDVPGNERPTFENTALVPEKVPYTQHEFNWRHYGYITRRMIEKALLMEEGPIKQGYVESILSYMKLAYRTWNKEHFVNDEIIKSDLGVLSRHQIEIDDNHMIENLVKHINIQPVQSFSSRNSNKNQNRNKPKNKLNNTRTNFKPSKNKR
ncbi:MAG: DUF4290 domain-containing protein [Saprospiraceae bacterium]|nr:DUF4290 domain-containing protein [Saprospiraceae bacterium]MBK6564958.1 DUF4290 domain-containing protein [Saprospiraceae bacterium]MBK6783106.1 DUF4290 domain-containing protein [Saprospiraceae bacterium]MBK7523598.1 DUF4290 domain-containing protein [Saprospiraceae bacterium]MBK8079708.1 DUF4290 domain-containing protein [Saprospiraceae bacterium]